MSKSKGFQVNAAFLENPFLIRQTETHLVFGPLSRHLALGWIWLVIALTILVSSVFTAGKSTAQHIGLLIDKVLYIVSAFIILKMSQRQQAIVGWLAVKSALGIAALIMMTVGAGLSFSKGKADAWPLLFLGLIWLPSLEFIPEITPHQRWLTVARILLSVPFVYLGVMSGEWHWH